MPIETNSLETARFGVLAARVVDAGASPDDIHAAAIAQGIKMLSVRIAVSDHARVHAFEGAGYRLMDTLLYVQKSLRDDLGDYRPASRAHCRRASAADAPAVGMLAGKAFKDYGGHYHVDPKIDNSDADAAYVEWATNSLLTTGANTPVVVAELDNRIVGFLTLRFDDDNVGEIVLNAVDPDCQNQGIYNLLLFSALETGRGRDSPSIFTSTQIDNYRVQRIWTRAGFVHTRSVHTFHKWL